MKDFPNQCSSSATYSSTKQRTFSIELRTWRPQNQITQTIQFTTNSTIYYTNFGTIDSNNCVYFFLFDSFQRLTISYNGFSFLSDINIDFNSLVSYPPTPVNIRISSNNSKYRTISWDRIHSYDLFIY